MPKRTERSPLLSSEEIAQAKRLGRLLRSRELAALVGSGLSAPAGIPVWSELVPRIFDAWLQWMRPAPTPAHMLGLSSDQYRDLLHQIFKDDLALTSYIRNQLASNRT